MKKKLPFKLTEEMIKIWKECVVAYLTKTYGRSIGELAAVLMAPDVLHPMFGFKGELLLRPGQKMMKAYYLKKGAAKLYGYSESGEQVIYYVWTEDSIIVLYDAFREKLPSTEYYIELLEDSELVGISSFTMDGIYLEHTVAHELTQKILSKKTDQRMLQIAIMSMKDKLGRYCVMKEKFPRLFLDGRCRLNTEDICAFINISESTLKDAKRVCPDD